MTNSKHTHIRVTMQDKWLKTTRYEHKWVDSKRSPKVMLEDLKENLKKFFVIAWYNEEFGADLDGDTEYYKVKFKFTDTEDRLTVHVFSDYCVDFAEGEKPPF